MQLLRKTGWHMLRALGVALVFYAALLGIVGAFRGMLTFQFIFSHISILIFGGSGLLLALLANTSIKRKLSYRPLFHILIVILPIYAFGTMAAVFTNEPLFALGYPAVIFTAWLLLWRNF